MARRREKFRISNDAAPALGKEVPVEGVAVEAMHTTEDFERTPKHMKDMRRLINKMVNWIRDTQSEYYTIGVRETTAEEHDNQRLFGAKEDLKYEGLSETY